MGFPGSTWLAILDPHQQKADIVFFSLEMTFRSGPPAYPKWHLFPRGIEECITASKREHNISTLKIMNYTFGVQTRGSTHEIRIYS